MLQKYIFGAHGALVVYDVTNSSSFESLEDWVNIIKRITKTQEKPAQLSLVGNKTDLEHRRAVRIEKHNKFAEQHGMTSHYVSAKTGDSVTLMFRFANV
uniref:Ras-related protein Rab-28 n=1 Tax=Ascaris lumbricoides TaxID=6252 RepID=A0A0M3HIH6_ASCLU